MEVEMLRPGTKIPHATTVSLDIKLLYVELSKTVHDYFKVSVCIYGEAKGEAHWIVLRTVMKNIYSKLNRGSTENRTVQTADK